MKVLWVVNIVVPKLSSALGKPAIHFGGWITTMISMLEGNDDISLHVVTKSNVYAPCTKEVDGVTYYIVPQSNKDSNDVSLADCERILNLVQPDLLHLEGTENAFSNSFLSTWKGNNIVSMQGIINGYEPYEYGQINILRTLLSLSPRKCIFALAMIANKHLRFNPRLAIERDTIAKAKNILGRTSWDRAHSYSLNPLAPYFSCNRILRDPFYKKCWNQKCFDQKTIFAGNVGAPRKGTHFMLKAISLLKSEYPSIKLRIAGESPEKSSIKEWKKYIGYPAYIRGLISELGLESNVEFLGVLSADEMADTMANSGVFVLSSIIENSPNTLGEAMILGMPVVAAYSGGVGDMAEDYKEALFYRANDPQVLAMKIRTLFNDSNYALKLGAAARVRALETHDPQDNRDKLLMAYKEAKALWEKNRD